MILYEQNYMEISKKTSIAHFSESWINSKVWDFVDRFNKHK